MSADGPPLTERELFTGYGIPDAAADGIWTASRDVTAEDVELVRPLLESAMADGSAVVELGDVRWLFRRLATGVPVDMHREIRQVQDELREVRELLELVLAELHIDPDAAS